MTPKSLLRAPELRLAAERDGTGHRRSTASFTRPSTIAAADKVRRVVLCSGKIYFDLLRRGASKIDDVAILRVEQLYPFPAQTLRAVLAPYRNAEVVWCQEEPREHGRLALRRPAHREACSARLEVRCKRARYVGRPRGGGDGDRPAAAAQLPSRRALVDARCAAI